MTLEGKTVLLGVTGSIAAYKIAYLASALKKRHADVHVLMTENATNFINPITFETLTGNKCLVDTFDRNFQFQVEHVSIAKKADAVMIAPASANVIGKLAHGIADDMLTTTIMACKCKKFISPAMNTNMFENPVVQDNLKILEHYGYEVIAPACGYLACGDTGAGKMPEPETLLAYIEREAACEKDLKGKKILVTAGPTQESVDPVRYLTNHSSGKMGYAIAKAAMLRGADVTLVSGRTSIEPPMFVNLVPVVPLTDRILHQRKDFIQDPKSCVFFTHKRKRDFLILCDQCQYIGISLKSGALHFHIVGSHHIQIFLCQLGSGIVDHILCLH